MSVIAMKAEPGSSVPGDEVAPGNTDQQEAPTGSAARQSEGVKLNVLEGGKSTAITSLLDIDSVSRFARDSRMDQADLQAVWRAETDVHGYPRTTARMAWKGDAFAFSGDVSTPSREKQAEMIADIKAAELPTIITLKHLFEYPPGLSAASHHAYPCHDFNGEIVMIHERYEAPDGKGYVPWTKWSDGQWRKAMPAIYPFYGLPGGENRSTLFLHEGAKAAARMKRLLSGEEKPDRFPWWEQMRWGHHVGWIGGVHSVGRSDWERLSRSGFKRVVIVLDNDGGGTDAGARIAPHFTCPTFVLRFGGSFPDRFDCGDEWPSDHFDANSAHIGVTFDECLQPFDQATNLEEVPGRNGRPKLIPRLRASFAESYRVVTETQQVFSVHRPALAMEKKAFNDEVRQRSHEPDTYALLIQSSQSVCARRDFLPNKRSGVAIEGGLVTWNAYEPSTIRAAIGDVGPWLDFLEHLFPIPSDRHEAMRWIATLIACRDRRMHYSMLLVSKTQGVGKSTLGLILRRLLGERNVSFPGDSAFESQFNSWAVGKLLVFVNEIYSNGRATVYDKIKPYAADEIIRINEKNARDFDQQNWAVFIACSNSEKALFIPDEDRRWFVPTVTNSLRDRVCWEQFHAWLIGGGFSLIRGWADSFAKDHAVKPGERPPQTSAKRAIIAENKSEGRLFARDFGEEFAEMDPAIVRIGDVRAWVARKRGIDLGHPSMEKERLIIAELEAIEGLHVWKGDARPKVGGRRGDKAAVVFNFFPETGATWGQVEDRLKTLETLGFEAAF